jgi:hypothetical protein
VAPPWFPLQSYRLAPALTYLLTIPAAYLLVRMFRLALSRAMPFVWRHGLIWRATTGAKIALAVVPLALAGLMSTRWTARLISRYLVAAGFYVAPSAATLSPSEEFLRGPAAQRPVNRLLVESAKAGFGNPEGNEALRTILAFARRNSEGRYLVELPNERGTLFRIFDSRAITSYLGAQGNEAVGAVFREASLGSLFVNPQVNAFSTESDAFGISSVLADDIDFAEQPLASHVRRAEHLGVRYLAIFTPATKDTLKLVPGVKLRMESAEWSVFELSGARPFAEAVRYRPALVVAGFSVKGRQRNDFGFTRLSEEQYADGWFDVPLARSQATNVEDAGALDNFGALVLLDYDCNDCDRALDKIRAFAATRPVIAVRRSNRLLPKLLSARERLPLLTMLDEPCDPAGPVVSPNGAMRRYGNSHIRAAWRQIRTVLETHKIRLPAAEAAVRRSQQRISVGAMESGAPILIRSTYHPRWQRSDGEPVYLAAPAFLLTFGGQAELEFQRTGPERAAAAVSALLACGLIGAAITGRQG